MSEGLKFNQDELLLLSKYTNSENITDILNHFGGDIDKLKSYVKWLYKYGGTGSKGNGNGNGNSGANWAVTCLIDNKLSGGTIVLSQSDNKRYPISISINRPGSSSYTCSIYKDSIKNKPEQKFTLNAENISYDFSLSITKNTDVIVKVSNNDDIDEKIINTKCILFADDITCELVDNNESTINTSMSSTIFYPNLKNGFNLKINHNVYVEATNIQLNVNINGGLSKIDPIYINLTDKTALNPENNKPYTLIDLWDILNLQLGNDDVYGTYSISVKLTYNFNGNNKSEKFLNTTIIPNGYYLKVIPKINNAQIYRNSQDINDENLYKFISKNIVLTVTTYGDMSRIPIIVTKDNNTILSQTFITNNPTDINIQLNNSTTISEHILQFNMLDTIYTFYIYLDKDDGTLKWFEPSINLSLSNYFRGTEYNSPNNCISLNTIKSINRNFESQGYIQLNMIGESNSINIYDDNIELFESDKKDLLISFGIQYSDVNSIENNIIDLNFDTASKEELVTIKQNKVIIGTNSYEIFIPKETNFDVTQKTQYHLLNILLKNIESNPDLRKYEMIIYIDGYIEQAISTYFTTDKKLRLNNIKLYEGNYSIDLLDVSYIEFGDSSVGNKSIDDMDIVQYYYKYQYSNGLVSNDELSYFMSLKGIMSNFKEVDINDQGVITSVIEISGINKFSDLQETLIKDSLPHKIPIFILHMNNTQTPENFFSNYFCKSYKDRDLNNSGTVLVNTFTYIDENNIPYTYNGSSDFELQGSSSGQFKGKNFTMKINTPTNIVDDEKNKFITLFTPNFQACTNTDQSDDRYLTYLPENIMLFKADAVDSTHANNTSAGLFINKNTTPFEDSRSVHHNANQYIRYVKNCLVGFPILVILGLKDLNDSDKIHYYFIGIYNCNLGRDSVLNLGYYDLNALNNLYDITDGTTKVNLLDGNHNGFGVYLVHSQDYQPVNNLCVAEIQGGNHYFDFSQYHPTILFEDNEGGEGMFGDFYPQVEDNQNQKNKIQMFVRNTSLVGGSLFTQLKKNMSDSIDDHYGYDDGYNGHYFENNNHWVAKSIGSVPNYKYQFNRFKTTFTLDNELTQKMQNLSQDFDWQNSLRQFIGAFTEQETEDNRTLKSHLYTIQDNINDSKISYLLDYNSLVEYYTICMAFGLVDSVQKNLNIKSFKENGPFYIAFYDMDTSFSRENGGSYIPPFAFSDYWGMDGNKNFIYRDFYPDTDTVKKAKDLGLNIMDDQEFSLGYDIPSSYLFAIAKYAKVFYKENSYAKYQTNPNYLWYQFRHTANSPLSNAKSFINNYFGINLNKINRLFFNANYRFKYLQHTSTGFDTTNLGAFHGRGLYSLEDWLNKRFHVLDAYFNIKQTESFTNNYTYYNLSTKTWEPLTNNGKNIYDPKFSDISNQNVFNYDNRDIYLDQTIFSTGVSELDKYSVKGIGTITFKALDYSAMCLDYGSDGTEQFICIDSSNLHSFTSPQQSIGSVSVKFGGSISWTYVKSLDTLIPISNILTIKSPYLENINIYSGSLKTLLLENIRSVKEINITSPNATCQLTLSNSDSTVNQYPNLRIINLQNSKCGLSVSGLDITTINAASINAPENSISVDNCDNLRDCNFNNASLKSIYLSSIWNNNITIDNSNIENIEIINSKFTNSTINITNNEVLKTLSLTGFENIIINNCPNLSSITFNEYSSYHIKSIQLINCCNYNRTGNITIKISGQSSIQDNGNIIIDLSQCKYLDSISFYNTKYISKVILPDKGTTENPITEITLLPFAFANTNLSSITFNKGEKDNHYLCLTSNIIGEEINCHTFYNSKFNYDSSDQLGFNFKVKNPNTSLVSIFEIPKTTGTDVVQGVASLSYSDLYDILTNLEGKENVISLKRAFLRQTSIEYKYDGNTHKYFNNQSPEISKHLSLSEYVNLQNCEEMLWGTNYNVLDNYIFGNGISSNVNKLSILNIIGVSLVYIHKDTLQYIKNKIDQFLYNVDGMDNDNVSYLTYNNKFSAYDDENGVLSEINIHEFLYDDNRSNEDLYITKLTGINFNNHTINIKNLFTNKENKVNKIVNCFNNLTQSISDMIGYSHSFGFNEIGLVNISDNLTLYNSFVGVTLNNVGKLYEIIDMDELVDITTFVSFDTQYVNIIKNLSSYNQTTTNIFNFYKSCQYSLKNSNNINPAQDPQSSWYKFWQTIVNQSTNINYLFNKTIFKFDSNSDVDTTIELPELTNWSKIKNAFNLFASCTGVILTNDNTYQECGIRISNNTINKLNIQSLSYIFENTTFNGQNSYPLPNDLFNGMTSITSLNSIFANTKIIGSHKTYIDKDFEKEIYYKYSLDIKDLDNNTDLQNYPIIEDNINIKNNIHYGYPIIPPHLFENLTNLADIQNIFADSDFEGYLPSNLFNNCPLTKIDKCFNNCKILPQYLTTIGAGVHNDKIYKLSEQSTKIYSLFPDNFINLSKINSLDIFNIYLYVSNNPNHRIYLFNDKTFNGKSNIVSFNVSISDNSNIISKWMPNDTNTGYFYLDVPILTKDQPLIFNICFNYNNSNNAEDYSEGLKYNDNMVSFNSLTYNGSILSPEMAELYYGYLLEKGTMLNEQNYFTGSKNHYLVKFFRQIRQPNGTGMPIPPYSPYLILPGIIHYNSISTSMFPTKYIGMNWEELTNTYKYSYLYIINNTVLNLSIDNIDINIDNIQITQSDNLINIQFGNSYTFIYELGENEEIQIEDLKVQAIEKYKKIVYYNYLLMFNNWNKGQTNSTQNENIKTSTVNPYSNLMINNNGLRILVKADNDQDELSSNYNCDLYYRPGTNILYINSMSGD